MTTPGTPWIGRVARITLGAIFVYVGIQKALDPVSFLKAVHGYGIITSPTALNSLSLFLPWLEIVCGVALAAGWKWRSAAVLQLAMLIVFTGAIVVRAFAIHRASDLAFCAIRFDCGCGTGEVPVCVKLLENAGLIALAFWVTVFGRTKPN